MKTTLADSQLDRRQFLQQGVLLSSITSAVPSILMGQSQGIAPSKRLNVGVIGMGGRGFNLMQSFLRQADVQVTAVCDVDLEHYRSNKWGKGRAFGLTAAQGEVERHYGEQQKTGTYSGCHADEDFRVLCARKDVDAVVVATPDHWHYHQVMEAIKQGKDVYCEKPVTHTFMEGKMIYREVLRRNAIFQTGSQQRSTVNFHRAVELVRNGHIGSINRVEVGLPSGYAEPRIPAEIEPVPKGLNYDFWSGPAPLLPYMRARHHQLWRGHLAYGGGNIMDWIGHHNDIAHWGVGMDHSGPLEVEAVGWTNSQTGIYNTPVDYEIQCLYPGKIEWMIGSKFQLGTKWVGDNGWIYVNRGKLEASDSRWVDKDFNPGPAKIYQSKDHTRNFIDGVKQRKECIAPAETGHRSITPGHLGYVSNQLGRKLKFDSRTERVIGDTEANALLDTSYRKPWKI
ncbi:MAG: Gfo/Idh/MocA family oxidoreductase [Verrucomicrobia bacterium]|jgi:predicted dehydrogenase|nr:Gfo/Idh/MocA family oxidoreductase [Verrucomicrobiota bacterium]